MTCLILAAAAVIFVFSAHCACDKEWFPLAIGSFLIALLFAFGAVNAAVGC